MPPSLTVARLVQHALYLVACALWCGRPLLADGLADNDPSSVRRVPKLGIEVTAEQRAELEQGLVELQKAIDDLQARDDARVRELLPDVQIYHRAVSDALTYQEFFDPVEVTDSIALLAEGRERAAQLVEGRAPWTTATGLVVRGYTSRIDGSVQPYGLVIPESLAGAGPHKFRLDIWFHGRGETLSEVNFLRGHRTQPGQFTPPDTIVLHPYGRYSNAFKFAGETDVLEALQSVQSRYRIDEDRISVRGFSMGGAACWQFAVHFADHWFAANPGAGFAETPGFLNYFQKETLTPTWFEKKLWHWYDCTDWALDLFHCPTVAYSGEDDIQKQAADIMQVAMAVEGINLVHVVGPKTGHSYHPDSAAEIERLMNGLAEVGRERQPHDIHFDTYTLKYNRLAWLTVDGLQQHWEKASVDAFLYPDDDFDIQVDAEGVTDFTLEMTAGWCPFSLLQNVRVIVGDQEFESTSPLSDRSWKAQFHFVDNQWMEGPRPEEGLRKRHDLQGPIDDAFMDSFIFVRPTGEAAHAAVENWSAMEMARAIEHWRRQFRGHARVKDDKDITEADIAGANLVLWGDPQCNALSAKIIDKLPIGWNKEQISVGAQKFSADQHALIAIYPNPLNPSRYVVLNSGFTFRDFAYLNNARQVAKLPDWAVVDLRTPPDSLWPGKIVAADFFDEQWQLRSPRERQPKGPDNAGLRRPNPPRVNLATTHRTVKRNPAAHGVRAVKP
jgi:hypothetical protein